MRILVAEDNPALADGLSTILSQNGYAVDIVSDGVSAEAVVEAQNYDLMILDLSLPQMDGLEVLKSMRARQNTTPVLILTARGALDDRIIGLDMGADDYLTKPFEITELEARIRVLLRRQSNQHQSILEFGPVTFDMKSRSVFTEKGPLEVSARELSVLETMMLHSSRVVSKAQLMDSLSGFDEDISDNAIEQYVSRLRKKLACHNVTIRTARGLGYYLQYDGTK